VVTGRTNNAIYAKETSFGRIGWDFIQLGFGWRSVRDGGNDEASVSFPHYSGRSISGNFHLNYDSRNDIFLNTVSKGWRVSFPVNQYPTTVGIHLRLCSLLSRLSLPFKFAEGYEGSSNAKSANNGQYRVDPESGFVITILGWGRDDPYIGVNVCLGFGLEFWATCILYGGNRRNWKGWVIAFCSMLCFVRLGVSLHREDEQRQTENYQTLPHNSEIVLQKHLTISYLLQYSNYMANVLNTDKQIAIIGALAEGSSIRSIERMTGVHRDTIMRLGVKVGQGCTALLDAKMRNLPCDRLELDEIWGFVGKKDRSVRMDDPLEVGSVWTWCAIDADTKLVPAFRVGDRTPSTAIAFVQDVANRMSKRVQISTDGLAAYRVAIESAFGADVDFAQIIKTYGHEETSDNRRYSAPEFVSSEKKVVTGRPNFNLISTSYIERLNATTRLHMRRLTRLTLAFSKKRENFEAAVGLHFAYYNFVKRHNTLRCTPAMAAGVEPGFWSVGDLVEATA
jgi:IS1 family transposase